MGTTAPIACDSCRTVNDVELEDVGIDPDWTKVSFSFTCTGCGHENRYVGVTIDEASKLIDPTSEMDRLADWLGVSREKYASYVYPPDVMQQADLERRKIPSTSVKEALKAGRQPYPELRDQCWWVVYKLPSLQVEVHYDREGKRYRIVGSSSTELCDTVLELGTGLREKLQRRAV